MASGNEEGAAIARADALPDGAADPRSRAWLVWTLAAAQLVSWGSLYYSFSLFVIPMQRELGWSKTELNGALSLGLLITGLSGLPVGAWIDRRGGRALMTLGSLSAAALLFAWSRVESLAAFYVIWALLGAVLASVLYDPAFAVLTRDFGPGFRKAILTLTLVAGFASTVFIPLTELLVEELGWRAALRALALSNLVPATLHALFLPGAGRKVRKSAPPAAQDAPAGLSPLRRAMRRATFWCLLASFSAAAATSSSVTFHLVPLLSERGVDAATIVSCIAVIGPMQVAGRLVLFGLGAKLGAEVLGSLNVLAIPLSLLALLLLPSSLAALVAFAALYGLGNGIMTIVRGTAVSDLIGREGYGSINGTLALPNNFAMAAAPFAVATLWAAWGGYQPVLWVIFAASCLSALAFWLAVATTRGRGGAPRGGP